MVAAQKVESKNEETWEKVRARATVTTNLREGMEQLSEQIAKLMVTPRLDRAALPPVHQVVPVNVAIDGGMVVGTHPVTQTPTMVGVVLAR